MREDCESSDSGAQVPNLMLCQARADNLFCVTGLGCILWLLRTLRAPNGVRKTRVECEAVTLWLESRTANSRPSVEETA
jgi:hypothetical protein